MTLLYIMFTIGLILFSYYYGDTLGGDLLIKIYLLGKAATFPLTAMVSGFVQIIDTFTGFFTGLLKDLLCIFKQWADITCDIISTCVLAARNCFHSKSDAQMRIIERAGYFVAQIGEIGIFRAPLEKGYILVKRGESIFVPYYTNDLRSFIEWATQTEPLPTKYRLDDVPYVHAMQADNGNNAENGDAEDNGNNAENGDAEDVQVPVDQLYHPEPNDEDDILDGFVQLNIPAAGNIPMDPNANNAANPNLIPNIHDDLRNNQILDLGLNSVPNSPGAITPGRVGLPALNVPNLAEIPGSGYRLPFHRTPLLLIQATNEEPMLNAFGHTIRNGHYVWNISEILSTPGLEGLRRDFIHRYLGHMYAHTFDPVLHSTGIVIRPVEIPRIPLSVVHQYYPASVAPLHRDLVGQETVVSTEQVGAILNNHPEHQFVPAIEAGPEFEALPPANPEEQE